MMKIFGISFAVAFTFNFYWIEIFDQNIFSCKKIEKVKNFELIDTIDNKIIRITTDIPRKIVQFDLQKIATITEGEFNFKNCINKNGDVIFTEYWKSPTIDRDKIKIILQSIKRFKYEQENYKKEECSLIKISISPLIK